MKIAILGTRGIILRYSGIEASLYAVTKLLAERGHKVTIFCHKIKDNSIATQLSKNIRLVLIPTIHRKHFATFFHTFFSTFYILFSDIDIAHFHALGPSFFSFLPRLFGKKTVVTVHGLDWKRKKWKYTARLFLRLCEYCAIYFPNKTIVVSENLRAYFERKFNKKVYYIPNGTDIPADNSAKSESLEERKQILFIGRLVPEKGVHCLIQAFNELKTDMKLIIAGESGFTDDYVVYLHSISGPQIDFLGFVENEKIHALYRNAYLFVLPSEVEGYSVSLLEAMAHGVCPLVSDISENLEIIGNSGFSFRSNGYLDLKDKLRYLIDHPGIVYNMGLKARIRACEKFNWGPIISEVEQLYASLFVN